MLTNLFLIIGIISLSFGVILIFSPDTIVKADKVANKFFATDTFFMKNKNGIGSLIILASGYLIYTFFSLA